MQAVIAFGHEVLSRLVRFLYPPISPWREFDIDPARRKEKKCAD
jgi:hypothetical protein